MPPQDDKTQKQKSVAKEQPILHVDEDEEIPKIQKTAPVEVSDLDTFAIDLRFPENIRQQVEYNDSTGMYVIGSKIGDNYLNAPVLMTPEEYRAWSEKRELQEVQLCGYAL